MFYIDPGRLNKKITIKEKVQTKDADGFTTTEQRIVAIVYAYFEEKHGSEKWVNRAELFEATALFRFRRLSTRVSTDMIIEYNGVVYEITSVTDIGGAYYEVMARVQK